MKTIKVNANITIEYNEDKYKSKDIKRLVAYAKHGLKSQDYDFKFFENDLLFKLKRIEIDLTNQKLVKHCYKTLKSLRRVIKLLEELDTYGIDFKYCRDDILLDDLGFELSNEASDYRNNMVYSLIVKYKFYWWW